MAEEAWIHTTFNLLLTHKHEFPRISYAAARFSVVGSASLKDKKKVSIEAYGESTQLERFIQSLSEIGAIETPVVEEKISKEKKEEIKEFFEVSNYQYFRAEFNLPSYVPHLVDGEYEIPPTKLPFKTKLTEICGKIGIAADIQKIEATKVQLVCCATQARFYKLLEEVRKWIPGITYHYDSDFPERDIEFSSIRLKATEANLHSDGSSGNCSREEKVLEVPSPTESSLGSSLSGLKDAAVDAFLSGLSDLLRTFKVPYVRSESCSYPVFLITSQPSEPFVAFTSEPVFVSIPTSSSSDLCAYLNKHLIKTLFPNAKAQLSKCFIGREGTFGIIPSASALAGGDTIYAFDITVPSEHQTVSTIEALLKKSKPTEPTLTAPSGLEGSTRTATPAEAIEIGVLWQGEEVGVICRDPTETFAAFLDRISREHKEDYSGVKVRKRGGRMMGLGALVLDFVKANDVLELIKSG